MIIELDRAASFDPETIMSKDPFRVLLVEDDQIHYIYAEFLLNTIFGARLQLTWVREAEEAVEQLLSNSYDICLLDYLLKGANARDVLGAVNLGLLDTAIIVVSAFEEREFVLQALRSGADDYVIKGRFNDKELERAIHYSVYRKWKEIVLRQKALYDPLTGLANRNLLHDRLQEVSKYSTRHQKKFAIMVFDVDGLKQVNDRFGHMVGDRLIKRASEVVVATLRSSDTVARVGGDEFVAVLKDVRDIEAIERICRNVCATVNGESPVAGEDLRMSCSIGVSIYPDCGLDIDELLRKADEAMYVVKRGGGNGYRMAG